MAYALGLWWTDDIMRIKRDTGLHEIEWAGIDLVVLADIAEQIAGWGSLRRVDRDGAEASDRVRVYWYPKRGPQIGTVTDTMRSTFAEYLN